MFFLIAGPCVVENEEVTFTVAEHLKKVTQKLGIKLIFKSSYKKANRTKLDSFTGLDRAKALEILAKVRKKFSLPVLTDIHESWEAAEVAQYVDYLQIPAFLCRQTDLLLAAGRTGKPVNIKKGQFMSPYTMKYAVEKVYSTGNRQVMLTERGSMFGYNDLVVDFRSVPIMKSFGVPVVVDCTHSTQKPNQTSGVTGGDPQMIETLALAAIATGADGLFMEVHPEPAKALSDAASQLQMDRAEEILAKCVDVYHAVHK